MVSDLEPSPHLAALRIAFRNLETWLATHCPHAYEDLQAGAKPSQLALVEAELAQFLPDELVAFFREHDGQSGDGPAVFAPFELLDVESALREWRTLGVVQCARPLVFPVASDGKGHLFGVKLAQGSTTAPVHEVHPDGRDHEVAPSLAAWLTESLRKRDEERLERQALALAGVSVPRSECHSSSFPPS